MTELDLIVDFHKEGQRQGPGSNTETLKALELTGLAQKKGLKIADIGCGTGSHTIVLARHTGAQIVGVDLFPEFLAKLKEEAGKAGVEDQVTTLAQSMDDLPFGDSEFDIIWSEGAIYNIGFEAGVKAWKKYLRTGGYLCVSEITWITDSRPGELEEFWKHEYPEVDTASAKIKLLENNGFSLAGYFYLKQDSWMDHYYEPMKSRFSSFLERHHYSKTAQQIVSECKAEIELYQKYSDHYSYGFYIARKN